MHTTPTNPLVLIPCSGRKRTDGRHAAGDLYQGSYYRLALRAALILTSPGSVRIVSARHGLLALDALIEPYDTRITDLDAITATELRGQAVDQGIISVEDVVIAGPAAYCRLAQTVWPQAHDLFAGTTGIGEQRGRLSRVIATGQVSCA